MIKTVFFCFFTPSPFGNSPRGGEKTTKRMSIFSPFRGDVVKRQRGSILFQQQGLRLQKLKIPFCLLPYLLIC